MPVETLARPVNGPSHRPASEAQNHLVQLLSDLPRIELFARTETPGWSVWGNDTESGITLEPRIKQHALL